MDSEQLVKYGIMFLVIAIMVGFSAVTLTSISDNLAVSGASGIENESVTTADNTRVDLAANAYRDCLITNITVINTTGGEYMPPTNYTYGTTKDNCSIMFINLPASYTGLIWKVNYTYSYLNDTSATAGLDNGTKSLENLTDYLPTLALVVIAAIILGSVIVFFRYR